MANRGPKTQSDDQLRLLALAEREKRLREGGFTSGPRAHAEYKGRIIDWIVDKLGMPEHLLRWSLIPGYQDCQCDQEVCNPASRAEQGGGHVWDGTVDPLATMVEAIEAGESVAMFSATGVGKAQPVDELVLTPDGWVPIGSLKVGDKVIGSNGKSTRVVGIYPQGVREVFRLTFSDGATTRACGEHLWSVKHKGDVKRNSASRIVDTQALSKFDLAKHSYRVPLPQPVKFRKRKYPLPVDPYVLGILLGDGSLTNKAPRFSTADPEIVDYVREKVPCDVVYYSGYDYALSGRKYGIKISMKVLLDRLGLIGCRSENKFIPREYMVASAEDRLELLRGLMDADGWVGMGEGKSKHIEYSSASEQLARDVVEIIRSLGGTAKTVRRASHLRGKRMRDAYRVTVNMPEGVVPFRLRRKAEKVESWGARSYGKPKRIVRSVVPDGEVDCVCIRVAAKDSLYVTNDYVVTHNTHTLGRVVPAFLAIHEKSIVVTTAPREKSLLMNLWKEIGEVFPDFKKIFPASTMVQGKLRMLDAEGQEEAWAATATVAAVGKDEKIAQGLAGSHRASMLSVLEDLPGVEDAILNTIIKTSTGEFNPIVGVGNPDNEYDTLSRFGRLSWVKNIRNSALDYPNVVLRDGSFIPGGRTLVSVQRDLEDTTPEGMAPNLQDPVYLSRVRGITPSVSEMSLIRLEWCQAAAAKQNDEELRKGAPALGVDPSNSETHGRAAVARGIGACCYEIERKVCRDASVLGVEIYHEAIEAGIDPQNVGVDAIGVGASTANKLKELGFYAKFLKGSLGAERRIDEDLRYAEVEDGTPANKAILGPVVMPEEQFANLRSQMYWILRRDLMMGRIAIPLNQRLFDQLCILRWDRKTGKIRVMPKETVIEKLGYSPDEADCLVYWNFVRRRRPLILPERDELPKRNPSYDEDFDRLMAAASGITKRSRRPF